MVFQNRPVRQTSFGPVGETTDNSVISKTPAPTFKKTTPRPVDPRRTVTIRPPKPVEPKTYFVTSGDSLGTIAKKLYGPVEGNKRANVTRIFEANRKLLNSPDQIKIGQKLLIPALPAKLPASGLLSGSQFKRVTSVGRRTDVTSPLKPVNTRFYTVKSGDSLWSISTDQLGNGIRYKEIAKLNKDVLPNEDDVRVGTQLKLPAK